MTPTGYTVPPPAYAGTQIKPDDQQPLLSPNNEPPHKHQTAAGARQSHFAWNDVEAGGVPGEFSSFTVSESAIEIRMAFIRKVYSILFFQIAATGLVGSIMRLDSCRTLLFNHSWIIFIPLVGALVSMIMLYAKRHSSPANLILLSIFTVLEAMGLGAAVAFVDTLIVLEALCLTGLVFVGLTVYTLQTKRDFSGLAPYLSAGLMILIFSSFLTIFFPLSRTIDAVYAGFGSLLFSAYIVFDTQTLCRTLSPDDWVVACVSLYLDAVNLFINIVRVLSDLQER